MPRELEFGRYNALFQTLNESIPFDLSIGEALEEMVEKAFKNLLDLKRYIIQQMKFKFF